MAQEQGGETCSDVNNADGVMEESVFVNGGSEEQRNSSFLQPEATTLSDSVIPRRSSLIKDGMRRRGETRKKTVSFSSMPGEKSVVNGISNFYFLHIYFCL